MQKRQRKSKEKAKKTPRYSTKKKSNTIHDIEYCRNVNNMSADLIAAMASAGLGVGTLVLSGCGPCHLQLEIGCAASPCQWHD